MLKGNGPWFAAAGLAVLATLALALTLPRASAQTASPTVTSFGLGDPLDGETFERGEWIFVWFRFSANVTVAYPNDSSRPRVRLTVGTATRYATYTTANSGPRFLNFRYTVQQGDSDANGIGIAANSLQLNGGTIAAAADSSVNATLAHSAIAASTNRKVDGSRLTAPSVTSISWSNYTGAQRTVRAGEHLTRVRFDFDRFVRIVPHPTTGALPRLALAVGTRTRYATPVSASNTNLLALSFRYTVAAGDFDSDGVTVAADALQLNGATIVAAADGATNADISHSALAALSPLERVATGPWVQAVEWEGAGTLVRGQALQLKFTFSERVNVTGTPRVPVIVGTTTRYATYSGGSGSNTRQLQFSYTVQQADSDTNGVAINANALELNGGTIVAAADGATNAVLSHAALSGGRNVDGSRTRPAAPTVTRISANSPIDGDTFERGETIDVTIRFSADVTVAYPNESSRPRVALTVGTATRYATYRLGSGQQSLQFRYTVQQADSDTNGLEIDADALQLNGGTIAATADSTVSATLAHSAVAASASRKVDGSRVTAPKVIGLSWHTGRLTEATTRLRTETIAPVIVRFDRDTRIVRGDGAVLPRLALTVGTRTRYATLYEPLSPTGTDRRSWYFRYAVAAGDSDNDGVTVGANALQLNGATIVASADGTTNADISHTVTLAAASPLEKVDGSRVAPPRVQGVLGNRGTHLRGERIDLRIGFTLAVTVTGTPRIPMTVGTTTRYATYSGGSGTNSLQFRYTVRQSDSDTDGIEVGANALELDGGTIVAAADGATAANLDHRALGSSIVIRVDGSRVRVPTIEGIGHEAPGTRTGEAVARGFQIILSVSFGSSSGRGVLATGQPRLELTIGAATRYASLQRRSGHSLVFIYTVQAGDADSDGIAIPANPIDLNGGTIASAVDGATAATLTHAGVSTGVNVDGSIQRGPRVDQIALLDEPDVHEVLGGGPAVGRQYGRGERITGWVRFNPPVDVTGTPRVALTIGSRTRHAEIFWPADPNEFGNQQLYFHYVVQADDSATNGIAVPADAVSLNGGTIRMRGTTIDADLTSDAAPASDHPYRVNGQATVAPTVRGVSLETPSSLPGGGFVLGAAGGPYRLGDTITARVWFSRAVEVTGTPQLALSVGGRTRQASFTTSRTIAISGHALTQSLPDTFGWMLFDYTVQEGDLDFDGIAVGADALGLNGGAIALKGGSTPAATLTHAAVAASASHAADGLTAIRADDEGPPVVGEPLVAGASHQSYRAEPDPPGTSTACDAFAASTSHEPWVWQRSDDGSTGWTDVSASRASDCTYVYVPASGDVGKYFRARIPLTAAAATAAGAPATDRYATTEVTAAAVASSTATAGVGLFLSGHDPPRVNGAIETMRPVTATERHRPHGGWRWRRCDDAAMTTNCDLLQDSDGLSYRYTPVPGDLNKHIEAWMYFSLDSGATWRRWAASPIGPVQAAGSGGGGGGGSVVGSSDPLDPCEADPLACGIPP